MNLDRLLHTQIGINVISVLLGLGLAALFRKVCTDKNCINFNGPILDEIHGKIYKFDERCYTYELEHAKCDANKKIVDIDGAPTTK